METREISLKLQAGKVREVRTMVQDALDRGIPAQRILDEGLLDGMKAIGDKFRNSEIFVPEVLEVARAMSVGLNILKPALRAEGAKASGRVCIGTVRGDLHDIGKNLVKIMMEGRGLEVVDLGTDVPAETFIRTAIKQNCQVICCSALLTTTMGVMADVVKAAQEAGIRERVKIIVGGGPVTAGFCREIGADAYTSDATSAAEKAAEYCIQANTRKAMKGGRA